MDALPRHPPRRPILRWTVALLGSALLRVFFAANPVTPLQAQEHVYRLFNANNGLNPPSVRSLTQDRAGYLWIGSEGGLFRYDGVEMRRWDRESIDRTITKLAASPLGPVVALHWGGTLFTINAVGVGPTAGPDGRPLEDVRDVEFDGSGGLWVIRDFEVWRRAAEGTWSRPSIPLAEDERPRLIRSHVGDAVHVVTSRGVWRIASGKTARRIPYFPPEPVEATTFVVDLQTTQNGSVLALTFMGLVFELTDSGPRELFRIEDLGAAGRAIAIHDRGETTWVSVDRYLVGWRQDGAPTVLDLSDGIESGGPLLVDHEGSLWMGSFVGLYQFPEPETHLWTERSGLPSSHARYLARTEDTVWVTTWHGAAYLRAGPGGWTVGRLPGWHPSQLFVDSRRTLWAGSDHGLLEVRQGRSTRRHLSGPVSLYAAHETNDGAIWLATSHGLHVLESEEAEVREVPTPEIPGDPASVESVLVDRERFLWVSSDESICRAEEGSLRSVGLADWTCETIPGAVHVSGGGLVETRSGGLWLSSNRLGVLRRSQGRWEPVPGARDLPSRSILTLTPARSGGLWVVGHGAIHRVTEALEDSFGWRIEERLGAWHGLPGTSGTHLIEDPDGGVWVTTTRGVAHLPASTRFGTLEPPRVVLVDARVDDEPVRMGRLLELPHDRNRLELRFAALSFRDPSLVRYQVRLSPDEPWLNTAGAPYFRWVDLPPGEYRAQVRASLDGQTWSKAPARFSFLVSPPWYREPWAMTLFSLVVAVTLYGAYRLRLNHLLELERQRTRIAMDLHDEIGSGLGSIGILSGMLTSDGLDREDGRRMAREIAATTGALGASLRQIVWTLDPRVRTMEEVARRLAEQGRRLFAGDEIEFTNHFPERWPEVRPSQLVRRNVVLIGLEALYNAARHARAQRVDLRLLPLKDGRWELSVADDGTGLRGPPERETGRGLRSVRRRAEEIGADLEYSSADGVGTVVRLTFRPVEQSRRLRWARRFFARSPEA